MYRFLGLPALIMSLSGAACSLHAPDICYTLRPDPGDPASMQVRLEFEPRGSGRTTLRLPSEWDGQGELWRHIVDLRPESRNCSLKPGASPETRVLQAPPGERAVLTWHVKGVPTSEPIQRRLYNRPLIGSDFFYVLGTAGLIVPEFPPSERLLVRLDWKGWPDSLTLASSLGESRRRHEGRLTVEGIRKLVLLGGDFRLRAIRRDGPRITLATRGDWGFPVEDLERLIAQLYTELGAMWGAAPGERVLVVALSTDDAEGNDAGECRTNGVSLYIPRLSDCAQRFAHLVSHELCHLWNPQALGGCPDERMCWFTEGVTEFCSRAALRSLGFVSLGQYVETVNDVIAQYCASPRHNLPVSEMVVLRKKDYEAERLPYRQGFLMALQMDRDIRERSNGGSSMFAALAALMGMSTSPGFALSNETISAAVAKTAPGYDAALLIENVVTRGRTLALAPDLLGPGTRCETREIAIYDAGFDVDAMVRTRIVSGVRPNSAAAAAGLRNGQRWTGGGLVRGDPKQTVHLQVEDSGGTHRVRYVPAAPQTVMAPQFTLAGTNQ